MKKLYTYLPESEDLKQARQKDAEAYREFLKDWHRYSPTGQGFVHGIGWHVLTYSHLYDAPRPE